MLLNYLKLSLRLLARNPLFTLINVAGLSVGFAVFFALWQYASSELKADQYHPNYERIARLTIDWKWIDDKGNPGHALVGWFVPATVHQIRADFPEVESYVRIIQQSDFASKGNLIGYDPLMVLAYQPDDGSQTVFKETKGACADPNLFEFFSIPLLYGERNNVLKDVHSIVLSEKTSIKYFGRINPVGELLILNGSQPLKVTGVFQDFPNNTHLNFDFVISNIAKTELWNTYTSWPCSHSYLQLKPGTNFEDFEKKIDARKKMYWAEMLKDQAKTTAPVMLVQPLEEVAYSTGYLGDSYIPKSKSLLLILSGVAILILIMAWVNYINLTLTRTAKRMKEVATRKTAGARPIDFMKQFLMESLTINLISLALAFTILQLASESASMILHIKISGWNYVTSEVGWLFLSVILLGVILTGVYPATMAMKYSPRKLTLSGLGQHRSNLLPGILTTFQYTLAIVLILWVLVIYLQLNFIFDKAWDKSKDTISIIEAPVIRSDNFMLQMESLKDQLVSYSFVGDVTSVYSMFGDDGGLDNLNVKKNKDEMEFVGFETNGGVSENFIPFFNIPILAGRNFRPDDRSDVIILSRRAIAQFGYSKPEDAIGEKIFANHNNHNLTLWFEVEVIGVIEDYPTKPLFNIVESDSRVAMGDGIGLTYKNYLFSEMTTEYLAFKLNTQHYAETSAEIEKQYTKLFPGSPFNQYFLEDHINRHYNNAKVSRNQIIFFTFLTIGIACLGLLGMITNKAVEKTKEIGIRKVLGAKLHQIAQILLTTTAKQIILATIIGIPVAYYLSQQYLERFSERITLQGWHFVLPMLILAVIMFLTIASVLWKAARSNPVEALKYE